jgi:hypothetical protein
MTGATTKARASATTGEPVRTDTTATAATATTAPSVTVVTVVTVVTEEFGRHHERVSVP